MPARLNDSFQASDLDARRLQCSVDRIWSRSEGETVSGSPAGVCIGGGSAPGGPEPASGRSKDMRGDPPWSKRVVVSLLR